MSTKCLAHASAAPVARLCLCRLQRESCAGLLKSPVNYVASSELWFALPQTWTSVWPTQTTANRCATTLSAPSPVAVALATWVPAMTAEVRHSFVFFRGWRWRQVCMTGLPICCLSRGVPSPLSWCFRGYFRPIFINLEGITLCSEWSALHEPWVKTQILFWM